jgi:regulator of RNase E activity RraA
VLVRQRDFVVGDADGVVVVPAEIALEVLGDVERLTETEADMRAALLAGAKFSEAYDRYRVG